MYDCGFMKEGNWFRYRAGGIVIKDHKMLFVKSAIGGYYYMIGGAVHMGETSEACIEREIFEESGIHAKVDHLAVVCENFFKGIGGSRYEHKYYRAESQRSGIHRFSETDKFRFPVSERAV